MQRGQRFVQDRLSCVGSMSEARRSCLHAEEAGNCPSCTHSGKYGADCSGLVAKVWQYGALPLETNSHPFSTTDFVVEKANYWTTIADHKNAKLADDAVYRKGGAGHIVMYEKGDAWGSPFVFECAACKKAACTAPKNLRQSTRSFAAISSEGLNKSEA
jgi:hypothetical protein